MPSMTRILMIVSSATEFPLEDGRQHPTGYWAEEVYKPLKRFLQADVELAIYTADGKPGRPDPFSLEPRFHYPDEDKDFLASVVRTFADDAEDIRFTLHQYTELNLIACRRVHDALVESGLEPVAARTAVEACAKTSWRRDVDLIDTLSEHPEVSARLNRPQLQKLATAIKKESEEISKAVEHELKTNAALNDPGRLSDLSDADILSFDTVFFPGGHGPMVDLADNPDVDRVLRLMHGKQRTIALLCHGPAALLSAGNSPDGVWLFDGYKVAAFSNEEESQTPVGILGPAWYLESELKNRGAIYDEAPAWTSHVVVDRNLITAQNQASAEATAGAVLKKLGVDELRRVAA